MGIHHKPHCFTNHLGTVDHSHWLRVLRPLPKSKFPEAREGSCKKDFPRRAVRPIMLTLPHTTFLVSRQGVTDCATFRHYHRKNQDCISFERLTHSTFRCALSNFLGMSTGLQTSFQTRSKNLYKIWFSHS